VSVNRVRFTERGDLEAFVETFEGGPRGQAPGLQGLPPLPVDWERLEAIVVTKWESRRAFEEWVSG